MNKIIISGLTVNLNTNTILKGIDFKFQQGKIYSIIGPNGSGKSTLLKSMAGLIKPYAGNVYVDDVDIHTLSASKRAEIIAMLPQNTHLDSHFSVKEMVEMGRHHKNSSIFKALTEKDNELVLKSMEQVGVANLQNRDFSKLSGGEKQRVLLARALAQDPNILLLDEPTASLDLNYQLEILKMLQKLKETNDLTIIAILHDIQLAAKYTEEMIFLNGGKIYKSGSPKEVITPETIKDIYNLNTNVHWDPFTKHLFIKPLDDSLKFDKDIKIHLIAGGGSGVNVMELLATDPNNMSIGVVNIGDLDWEKAKELKIKAITEEPYNSISNKSHLENLEVIKESHVVMLCNTPFGHGNLYNLEAVLYAQSLGKKVIIIGDKDFAKRDFTMDKKATEIFAQIMDNDNVHFAENVHELYEHLRRS